jgi:hydroxyacylglutathione hydrolase
MMTAEKRLTKATWLQTRQLDAQTWAIDDRGEDICYLACGSETCLLMDTGWGIGDLKSLVHQLCSLPLIVVNTHGHPDHTFGNWQFPEVYISEADISMVGDVPSLAMRHYIAEDVISSPFPEDFDVDSWMVGSDVKMIAIQGGHTFNLGNRSLEVINLPGHSPGSIALLDRERRCLFTGDTFFTGTIWLHLSDSLPLREFRTNLQRLQRRSGEFDVMYPAHGELDPLGLSPGLIEEMITGISNIINGTVKGEPETTHAGDGLRVEFESFSIIYNPDRL